MKTALLLLFASTAAFAKDIPAWVRDIGAQPVKSDYPVKVTRVELLQEERLAVDPDGKRVMTERRVIKILRTSPHAPVAFREYNTKAGRIRDFRAWLLLPSGKEVEYTKDRIVDVAMTNDKTPYDEERAKMIECDKDAPPGAIFAYEVTEEESTIFTTHPYYFQEADPVLVSRFVLSLPPSWEARGTFFNHPDVQPKVEGNTFTWELHDLPPMADEEEHSPRFSAIAPRLGITYFPTNARKPELVPLKDWHSVSAWQASFADPSAEATPAIHAKSDELTRQAKTEIEKIRAIAAFVQQTNYVSVDLNVMHGGGYIPHPATQVLAKNYGDCKDKAALMRALLKAANVDSYEVGIYSGDRHFVRPEWPSAMQFNHAIVAVKVSPETNLPTVVEVPKMGRLLIFDPTDSVTPVGGLPREEQGSYALVEAGLDGDLVKMPQLPASANRIERVVEVEWNGSGQLVGHMVTKYSGQSASMMRYTARQGSIDELKKNLERSFSRRLGGVTLDKITPTDHVQEDSFELAMDFTVLQFGQLMQGRMLLFKPGILVPDPDYLFPGKERKLPVKLSSRSRKDAVTVKVPAGFAVDEMPDPAQVESPYGTYHASWKAAGQTIHFEQQLEIKDAIVEVPEYPRVKDFFDKVAGGQAAPVVLVKP
jgi:transglutaminase-like putative cysteine protease